MRTSCVVSMPVRRPNFAARVASVITTSSSDVLPARSPMPLMVTSAWRAPARMPASVFAVASPRSSWQCTERMTPSTPGTFSRMPRMSAPNSSGVVYPTVSGMFSVVAPARMARVERLVEKLRGRSGPRPRG